MTICPFAIQKPGPAAKTYAGVNGLLGVIEHSAEGYEWGLWDGIANGPYSWHFTILYDGSIWQHYPLTARCIHAGSSWGNLNLIGVEHEGVAGENLTPLQAAASVRLTRWIAEQCGWEMERGRTLFEHREIGNTTCPNGRIPWEKYTEEEDVEVRIVSDQSEAIQKLMQGVMQASPAIGRQDGRYIGVADAGEFEDIVIRTRKNA